MEKDLSDVDLFLRGQIAVISMTSHCVFMLLQFSLILY